MMKKKPLLFIDYINGFGKQNLQNNFIGYGRTGKIYQELSLEKDEEKLFKYLTN
jgi:hypothetical protein